jgi:hypothetical protein
MVRFRAPWCVLPEYNPPGLNEATAGSKARLPLHLSLCYK